MKYLEEPYRTPPGWQDFPFAYVYDASSLTDGNDYHDIAKPTQGDSQFILRRITGVDTVIAAAADGGRFSYKNASGSYAQGNVSAGICFPKNWPVLPEKTYSFNDSILFDLYDVSRAIRCGSVFYSTIAFQGVKRFPEGRGYPQPVTPYPFREVDYSYSYDLTVNWNHFTSGSAAAPPHRFVVLMEQYDFELMEISIALTDPSAQTGALATQDFAVMLYDANMHQLSDLPLNQGYINSGRITPAQGPPYQASTPVPCLLYPAGGAITFDVTSLLCDAVDTPRTYNIRWRGVWRIPCNASR